MTLDESKEKVKIQDWVDEKFKDKLTGRNIQQLYLKSDLVDSIYEYSQIRFNEFDGAFLAGLKTGKDMNVSIKWHDLQKDPNDLPKNRRNVWITYINAYYQTETTEASFRHKYWVINGHKTECDVIAWCEIPKYTRWRT